MDVNQQLCIRLLKFRVLLVVASGRRHRFVGLVACLLRSVLPEAFLGKAGVTPALQDFVDVVLRLAMTDEEEVELTTHGLWGSRGYLWRFTG